MDKAAMTRKAMPAQSPLPVKNQTTRATMAAGRKKNKTFAMNTMIMRPITKRISPAKSKRKDILPPPLIIEGFRLSVIKSFDKLKREKGRKGNYEPFVSSSFMTISHLAPKSSTSQDGKL